MCGLFKDRRSFIEKFLSSPEERSGSSRIVFFVVRSSSRIATRCCSSPSFSSFFPRPRRFVARYRSRRIHNNNHMMSCVCVTRERAGESPSRAACVLAHLVAARLRLRAGASPPCDTHDTHRHGEVLIRKPYREGTARYTCRRLEITIRRLQISGDFHNDVIMERPTSRISPLLSSPALSRSFSFSRALAHNVA